MENNREQIESAARLVINVTRPYTFTSKRIVESCCPSIASEDFVNAVIKIVVSNKISVHSWPENGYQNLVDSGKARPIKEIVKMIKDHFIKTGIDSYEKEGSVELPKPKSRPNKVAQELGPDTLRILIELALIQRERGTLKDNNLSQTVWFRLKGKYGSDAPGTARHVAALMQVLQTKRLMIEDLVYDWQLTDIAMKISQHYIKDK